MLMKIWTTTLVFLAWLCFCAWLVLVCHEKDIRPLRDFCRFFKKQSKVGRVLLGTFFIAMWVIASTKPGGGNGGGDGGGGDGGTNNVQMVVCPGGGLQPLVTPGAVTNNQQQGFQGGIHPPHGGLVGDPAPVTDQWAGFTPIVSTNTTHMLTGDDFRRGFVMARIGTDEEFDFSAPPGATVCEDWRAFGSATDWMYVALSNWVFQVGTNEVSRLRVYSFGKIDPLVRGSDGVIATNNWFAPFMASLGIVPEANWNLLDESARPSQLWYCITPQNTLVVTWQNALLDRDTEKPISFQVEFCTDGRFSFRYDLSRLDADAVTNILAGASFAGNAWATNSLPTNVTSMAFYPLTEADAYDQDPDNDGLLTIDELFVHYTDPRNADSDYDGLSDYEELFVCGTDPLDPYSTGGAYSDGLAIKIGDLDPFSYPEGSTNTVLEHIFYSGTTNGVFAYPQSSESMAVLQVSVSGSGTGDLIVGNQVVPLVAPPQLRSAPPNPAPPLLVQLVKGETYPIYFRGDELLEVSLNSADFAFGVLPTYNTFGHINFPNTVATTPCIHDFNARRKGVYLPMSRDAHLLTCTWHGSSNVEVENNPPRAATITGNFSARSTSGITYTLSHPQYLFGQTSYDQTVRFCPQPPDPDPEDPDPPEDPPWYSDGDGDDSDETDDDHDEHWCCYWGTCDGWCGCGCDCGNQGGDPNPLDDADFDDDCPTHSCPYDQCAHLHEDDYTNAVQNVQHLGGVLYIREPPFYEQIHLDVPTEHRNCCPCPDHWTNYVGVAYKSYRLRLIDSNGMDFSRTETSCDVNLAGVYPSSSVGDATLAFSRNGEIYQQHNKTVLGVAIKGDYGVDLAAYNALNSSFGYPMTVCTNLWDAPSVRLVTNVKLPDGKVHLELANATGQFTFWYYDHRTWEYRKLLDTDTATIKDISMAYWKALMRRASYGESSDLPIYITSSSTGTVSLVFRYWNVIDGKFVQDQACQKFSSVNPVLLVDYDRDGVLGAVDIIRHIDGRYAYFWQNDDKWKGDDAFESHLINRVNSSDNVVNGRNDLINFLPISVDLAQFATHWSSSTVYYRLEAHSSALREAKLAFASIARTQIGDAPLGNDNDIYGNSLREAPVFELGNGTNLPPAFVSLTHAGRSTLFMEFPEIARYDSLYLNVYSESDNALLFSTSIKLHIGEVSKMIGWENLRSAAGGSGGLPTRLTTDDWPINEHKVGNVVFVHGYNMAEGEETQLWAQNVFKKLWWSGLDRGFIAVQWRGNEGQVAGTLTPNYYGNVQNAFQTAPALSNAMATVQGPKWFVAHSLGNMLVSAATQDYGMQYEKYFMLNAAIAIEAFDPVDGITTESHDNMTPRSWTNYVDKVRATHWFERFPEGDGRRLLTWKNRFPNVLDIVNFHSTEEDVVNNGDGNLHSIAVRNYVWYNQETRKGLWPMMLHEYEGGWEFNSFYDTVMGSWLGNQYIEQRYHMSPANAAELTDPQLRQKPFFLDFANPEIYSSPNGVIVASNYLYRAEMLAYAIPSESFAVGANPLPGLDDVEDLSIIREGNYDMATLFHSAANEVGLSGDEKKWVHSTFVQRSYRRTKDLYRSIMTLIKQGDNQ